MSEYQDNGALTEDAVPIRNVPEGVEIHPSQADADPTNKLPIDNDLASSVQEPAADQAE